MQENPAIGWRIGRSASVAGLAVAASVIIASGSPPPIRLELDELPDFAATEIRIDGSTLSFRADGFIDPLRCPLERLLAVRLGEPERLEGVDVVELVNGDHVPGKLRSLTVEALHFEATHLGELEIPRGHVGGVRLGAGRDLVIFTHDFTKAGLGDWFPDQGDWRVKDGAMRCVDRGIDLLARAFDEVGPCTMEVVFDRPIGSGVELGLGASEPRRSRSGGVGLQVTGKSASVSFGSKVLGSERLVVPEVDRVRLSHDPISSMATYSIQGVPGGRFRVPEAREQGGEEQWLTIMPSPLGGIRSVTLLRGVHPAPGTIDDGWVRAGEDAVVLSKGDRNLVGEALVSAGKVRGRGPYGELEIDLGEVDRIALGSDGRVPWERPESACQVWTPGGLLHLEIEALDGEELRGRSPLLGEVALSRAVVSRIVRPRGRHGDR